MLTSVVEPTTLGELWVSGKCLGSAFAGGVLGNLAAAFVWDAGKWVVKPLLDKVPDIAALLHSGGGAGNHDVLRVLRRAECAVVVALCDETLLDDFGVRSGSGSLAARLRARLRERGATTVGELCRIRRAFATTYAALEEGKASVADLVAMHGAALEHVQTLVAAGRECLAASDPDGVRSRVVGGQVDALERAVTKLGCDGLPAGLRRRIERHPGGWWDLLRLAFREELKDPKNARARAAWEIDVLSLLPELLGGNLEEFNRKFASLDEDILGVWNDLKAFRDDLAAAIESLQALVSETLAEVRGAREDLRDLRSITEEGFERLGRAPRATHVPRQLPRRALAGTFFGRQHLLETLEVRLRGRQDTDVWGPAGMGKTALAAEAIHPLGRGLPGFRGHPESHESAVGECHGEAEAESGGRSRRSSRPSGQVGAARAGRASGRSRGSST